MEETMLETPDSARKLRGFISKEYLNNPEMGSPDWSAAIRDILSDLMHLGDMFDVNIRERLEGAQEVYEQETDNELSAKTGVTE
jgi:hypothetical protein